MMLQYLMWFVLNMSIAIAMINYESHFKIATLAQIVAIVAAYYLWKCKND